MSVVSKEKRIRIQTKIEYLTDEQSTEKEEKRNRIQTKIEYLTDEQMFFSWDVTILTS